MKNFKDLEETVLNETPLPLGIKSNVQGQLGNMRTFGGIIELYVSKILDILAAMFGGADNSGARTHLVKLFVPSSSAEMDEPVFLKSLQSSFDLSALPIVLEKDTKGRGMEISMKMAARDAAQFSKIQNKSRLADMRLELR